MTAERAVARRTHPARSDRRGVLANPARFSARSLRTSRQRSATFPATESPLPVDVSRETFEALTRYLDLLAQWNRTHNLVGRSTLDDAWTRHVADSLQLLAIRPQLRRILDLGSGAGLPGLVLAIALRQHPETCVDLVESNRRKAAFLTAAASACEAPAKVHPARIEDVLEDWTAPLDAITARALAPLPRLLALSGHLIRGDTVGLFHKGVHFAEEIVAARRDWRFEVVKWPSATDSAARILEIRDVAAKGAARP